MTPACSDPYKDNAVLNELCNLACDRLDGYLEYFGLDLRPMGRRYIGKCPVHGGRQHGGVNLYPDGYSARGNWECHGNKCHKTFRSSLIGLTRGVMSHDQFGWSREGDRTVTVRAGVDEILKFLGLKIGDVRVDPRKVERRKFLKTADILSPEGRPTNELCTRTAFHRGCVIPASYYLDRGYDERTLKKFEVGECIQKSSPNFGRVLVPIYDPDGNVIIGALSRSQKPRCEKCRLCHDHECPPCSVGEAHPYGEYKRHLRWNVEPQGFVDKHHLYNIWRARKRIETSRCIVIVEGAGDLWRLDEAGIQNVVAIMGSKFTELQQIAIEECSPSHVVIMTDDDDAGNAVADDITQKWRRLAHVHRIKPDGVDLGDMSTADVAKNYRRMIESWMK